MDSWPGGLYYLTMRVPAWSYRQFDADHQRDVPAETYGGWHQEDLSVDRDHTAFVVMHAWEPYTEEEFPGWYRAVEYLPRSRAILDTVFPPLLGTARNAGITLLHVVGGGDYYKSYPGYRHAVELAGADDSPPRITPHESVRRIAELRGERVFAGRHNEADVAAARARRDFPAVARPCAAEGVAETANQLDALCREADVSHLIYAGFAVNWCLLMSPGGMLDMSRRGYLCSAVRQAVTAVENRESARTEAHKEEALWRVSLAFGYVFDVEPLLAALSRPRA